MAIWRELAACVVACRCLHSSASKEYPLRSSDQKAELLRDDAGSAKLNKWLVL